MEFKQIIKGIIQKYQYWRAPSCEVCGLKLVDQGKRQIIYRGNPTEYLTQTVEISVTEKGSIRFQRTALAFGSGIYWTIADFSWCKDDTPLSESLYRTRLNLNKKEGQREE